MRALALAITLALLATLVMFADPASAGIRPVFTGPDQITTPPTPVPGPAMGQLHQARLIMSIPAREVGKWWSGVYAAGHQKGYPKSVAWWIWANRRGEMFFLMSRLGDIGPHMLGEKLKRLGAIKDRWNNLLVLSVPDTNLGAFCNVDANEYDPAPCDHAEVTKAVLKRLGLEHFGLISRNDWRDEANETLVLALESATPRPTMACGKKAPATLEGLLDIWLGGNGPNLKGNWPAFARLIRTGITEGGRWVWYLTSNSDATPTLWLLNMGTPITMAEAASLAARGIQRSVSEFAGKRELYSITLPDWNMFDGGYIPISDGPAKLEQAFIRAAQDARAKGIVLIACPGWREQAMARARDAVLTREAQRREAEGDADAGRVWAERAQPPSE